ncbi:MAG: ribonuclease [Polaromonas sp.]|nr:ribonuclease [Polaromonas sp.]
MFRNGWGRWRTAVRAVLLVLSVSVGGLLGLSPGLVQAKDALFLAPADTIAVIQLPSQGRGMLALIYQGGPFRHDKDNAVFGNRERILPARDRGYYREYTVRTPGERTRGARRIVCGGLKASTPDACYYTDDHYASFRRIVH